MHKRHILSCFFALLLTAWSASALAYTPPQAGDAAPQQAPGDDNPSSRAGLNHHGEIQVSEEYNDNVNDTNRPKADFVTVVSPALDLSYDGNRVKGSVSYHGELRLYNTGQHENEMINTLDAKALAKLIENTLVLDVSDQNAMVFRNVAQGTPTRADSTRNQVNQNIASVGLTLTPHIAERTNVSLGYRATAALYGDREAPDTLTQIISLDVLHDLTPKAQAGFGLQAERQLVDTNGLRTLRHSNQGSVTRFTATLVGNYAYSPDGLVFCRIGAIHSLYDRGGTALYPTWSAGLTRTVSKVTFMLQTEADYENDPSSASDVFRTTYTASAAYAFARGAVTLHAGYSEYFGSSTHYSQDLTAGADISYDLTKRLKLSLGASRAGWDTNNSGPRGNPIRYYGNAELAYQLPKDFAVKLYYQGKITPFHSSRRNGGGGNVNIIGLGISMAF